MSSGFEKRPAARRADGGDDPAPGNGRLLTVEEVAEMLRINKSTVYRMAKQGRLPATRVGRQWRFRESVLEGLLEPG